MYHEVPWKRQVQAYKWQAFASAAQDGALALAELILVQQEDRKRWLWQVEKGSLLRGEETAWISWGSCLCREPSRSWRRRKGQAWDLDGRPWQWPGLWGGKEQSRPQSCHLLCPESSHGSGKALSLSWKCSHAAGSGSPLAPGLGAGRPPHHAV